ncbi:hypothetical protein ACH46_05270 [Gordonia phthalatica]|uniref:ESX-1 secretion-associated protein n=1 Tax=Gordonia phthalatica TaxID=1136941 RepID=A0A0N9NEM6_9ACTN|nr:hypothetical protein ACH46_05270 [Gordonia phthalatica]
MSVEDLVYQRELWSRRAAVARECGEELGELARSLARVVEWNYFGRDCVEGQSVYDGLAALIDSGVGTLERVASDAVALAAAATGAIRELESADGVGGTLIGGQ